MVENLIRIGIDLGSRRTKIVKIEGNSIIEKKFFNSWPLSKQEITEYILYNKSLKNEIVIGATGYYRYKAREEFGATIATEILAFAKGVAKYVNTVRFIIDVGGQDAKVIVLNSNKEVENFEMNDKCAAGTGKFFELVATTLNIDLDKMIELSYNSSEIVSISSTCAVFAESEIISKLADNYPINAVIRGVFRSVAERISSMFNKLNSTNADSDFILLVGGGANKALAKEIQEVLGMRVVLHEFGSYFGAIGAAFID